MPAAGQYRVPTPQTYRFVSDMGNGAGVFVNPGASGFFAATLLTGNVTFDRPEDSGWEVGQWLLGVQWGPLGFGYVHDEYHDTTGFSQGDNYTVSAGFAARGNGVGAARTWRTVGGAEGSWDVGYLFVSQSGLSIGLTWRDIGSPVVRDTVLDERVVGAISFREAREGKFSLSIQGDYRTRESDFRAFRIGGSVMIMRTVEVLAQAQWDGDGNLLFTGVVGLESTGDVRMGNAGASFVGQRSGL
jgi:hypothetical protein